MLLPRRWMVERTFGWFNHYRALSKGDEVLPSNSEARWQTTRDIFLPNEVYAREAYLRQISHPLVELGYEVTTEILKGPVVENIISVARDDFDVVVMATHGRTGLTKLVMGSIAEAVLHQSPCPVLLIPASRV